MINILVYYYDENLIDFLEETVLKMPVEINISCTNNLLECIEKYDNKTYDIVFIDENKKNPQNVLFEILKKNSSQRVITLHETFECSIKEDCTYCKNNYTVNRVQKPIVEDDIKRILLNKYKCDEYLYDLVLAKLNYIDKTMKQLYSDYSFDSQTLTFISLRSNHLVNNFIYIKEKLEENNINYIVSESNDIKILR